MKITSMDVHRKEFGHAVRGYREDEVDDFLDAIAVELDRLQAQIEELGDRAQQSESQAMNFEAERNTINNALLTAQRASDEVLEQAKEKGERLLEEADARAEKILTAAKEEQENIIARLAHLKTAEEKFRADILEHAQATIENVKEIPVPKVPRGPEVSIPLAAAAGAAMTEDTQASKAVLPDSGYAEDTAHAEGPWRATERAIDVDSEHVADYGHDVDDLVPRPPHQEGIGQYGEMEEDLETIDYK